MSNIFHNEKKNLFLEINEEKTLATLKIEERDFPISEYEILSLIEKSGISYGFENAKKDSAQKELIRKTSEPFVIARSDSVESASSLNFLFDEAKLFNPKKLKDDFSIINSFEKIVKGTPLIKITSEEDKTAKNIFGEPINEDNSPIESDSILGENVIYDEKTKEIIATKNGYPFVDDEKKIHIISEIEIIYDNIRYLPEINFFGNLIINDDLNEKIYLNVTGNLTINGDVDNIHLNVKGNITINGDVMNCMDKGIWATKNIKFNSAENSRIVSKKSIHFESNCHFCRLIADDNILGSENQSSVIGGLFLAGENIEVAVIGNSNNLNTDVEITIRPYVKEKMLITSKELAAIKKSNIGSDKILDLENKLLRFEGELQESFKGLKIKNKTLPNKIICFKRIFPGVYLRILKKSQTIIETAKKCSFTITNGDLIKDYF